MATARPDTEPSDPTPDESDPASQPDGVVTMPFVSVSIPPLERDDFDARYALSEVLGQGGMGDVFVARDRRIGREVALKAARPDGGEDVVSRFNRECRLQGQLEHPGVLPVYDLGNMADGAPFFTMKRIRGDSLENVLRRLSQGDAKTTARFSRARLLAAFVTVCQTVHFAHRRGVVHRDIKPANVMLGDFGEVYVIDWGIAKVAASTPASPPPSPGLVDPAPQVDATASHDTSSGELLGTLGYMAPEQLKDARVAEPSSDVYSLGAILFEILALERLHPSDRAVEVADATLASSEERIRRTLRARAAPPELEDACVYATALDRRDRFASVDELLSAVQRFLDGDRDVEARAKLAEQEARLALRALSKLSSLPAQREVALEHAGRALALAPSHALAQEVILRLMLDQPGHGDEPLEVQREMERNAMLVYRRGAAVGALLHAMWLPFILVLAFTRPKEPAALALWAVLDLVAVALLAVASRARERTAAFHFVSLVACIVATDAAARVVGPFITVPGVVTLTTVTFMLLGRREWHVPTAAIGAVGLVAPYALELAGVIQPTTSFSLGEMRIASPVVELRPGTSALALASGTIVLFAVLCLAARYLQRILLGNARRMALQQWKLKSLVPRGVIEPPSSATPSR